MPADNNRPAILSTQTLVPLGAAALIIGGGYASYDSIKSEIRNIGATAHDEIRDVKEDVRALRADVNNRTDDRWRKTDMKLWTLQLQQALGPSIHVPVVD